jgi:hypothetical protein
LPGGLLLHALSLEFPAFTPAERQRYPETAVELAGKTLYAPLPKAFLTQITKIFGNYSVACGDSENRWNEEAAPK